MVENEAAISAGMNQDRLNQTMGCDAFAQPLYLHLVKFFAGL